MVRCITKIWLTEYNGTQNVLDLDTRGDLLFLDTTNRVLAEDTICGIFSNRGKHYVRARFISRECTISELVELKSIMKIKTLNNYGRKDIQSKKSVREDKADVVFKRKESSW